MCYADVRPNHPISFFCTLQYMLVVEFSKFALDCKRALAFFYMTHYLSVDIETLANGNHLFGYFRTYVYFESVTHVEYFVHFSPIRTTLFGNGFEEGFSEWLMCDGEATLLIHCSFPLGKLPEV